MFQMSTLWPPLGAGAMLASVDFSSLMFSTLLACLCLLPALWNARRKRLADNLPVSKTAGVFIGLVKLKGTAESGAPPFLSYLAGRPCVQFSWTIDEEWSRVVTETYTDSNGRRQTRQRTQSGWKTVAGGGQGGPFYVRDDCGVILVRPDGATIEPLELVKQTCGRNDPLYYGKGPPGAIPDSTFHRRFHETAIPLHCPLYVIGQARERTDVVAPEIARDKQAPTFLISTRTEKELTSRHAWRFWLWSGLGLFLSLLFYGWWSGAPYLLVLALAWTWMVFNSMVFLRQRVNHAWSEVNVQLKRRADLIPKLVSVVQGCRNYEAALLPELAALRSQLAASAPGTPAASVQSLKHTIGGIAERYPELKANASFTGLLKNLIETEQRIALARGYFNDIATRYNTRLQTLPDRYITRMGGMKPEPLMLAGDFERAPVLVNLDNTPSQFSSHAASAAAVASPAIPAGETNRPSPTEHALAAALAPAPVISPETPPPQPSFPPARLVPEPASASQSETPEPASAEDMPAGFDVKHAAPAGISLLVFVFWIGALILCSKISNSAFAAAGLISGFIALLAGAAALALRRKLLRRHFRAACAVSIGLSCVSLIALSLQVTSQIHIHREEEAKDMLKGIPGLYQTDQFEKVCEQFEKAGGLTHSIPYDDYTKYIAACAYIRHGKTAGKTAEQFLKTYGWISSAPNGNVDWSPWVVLFGYAGYQQAGESRAAKKLVDDGYAKCNKNSRLYPVIAFLHGGMDESALESSIGNNPLTLTEADALIGIKELYAGDRERAVSFLLWVAVNGRGNIEAYRLAVTELRRVTRAVASLPQTGRELAPTQKDVESARAGFNRVESLWRSSEYDKLCQEFDQAFGTFPAPSYNAIYDYVFASACVRRGDAAGRFARYALNTFGWKTDYAPYGVLYGYVGCRQAGNPAAAKALLDDAAAKCNTSRWPYPIIACLRGDIGVSELESAAGNDLQQKTEAATFAGIQELYDGRQADAGTHLGWVQKNGRKDYPPYGLAMSELAHGGLPNAVPPQSVTAPANPPITRPPTAPAPMPAATTPPPSPAIPSPLSPDLQEILKLSQAGMRDDLITNFISHSGKSYKLRADDIIYLSSKGVSIGVIRALQAASPAGGNRAN
jgi:lipoprotein NlpI